MVNHAERHEGCHMEEHQRREDSSRTRTPRTEAGHGSPATEACLPAMAAVDLNFATLDEALRAHRADPTPPLRVPDFSGQRRRVFRSVFQTDLFQPTPHATPVAGFPSQGQAFGGPAPPLSQATDDLELPDAADADDQVRYDRAWHVVTARIALPSSATAEDSFGTLPPASQTAAGAAGAAGVPDPGDDFHEALYLVLHAGAALPRAHAENLLAWHTQQVRHHYAQHVLPLLAACLDDNHGKDGGGGGGADHADRHLAMLLNCVRTLEAAFRLYLYGMRLIARGLPAEPGDDGGGGAVVTAGAAVARFQRDVHTLVAKSASPRLRASIRTVFTHFASILLGFSQTPPAPPADTDAQARAVRQAMHELLDSLHHVGLAGDDFQILFAEIMDRQMIAFIQQSFAGRWDGPPAHLTATAATTAASAAAPLSSVGVLLDWVENHFARLAHEVQGHIGKGEQQAVSFVDVRHWKERAVGRLSVLRMAELFDIVLHWPRSRGGLEDLRVSVTTALRRAQLAAAFTAAMRARLLHPACPTLEILQTYVAMIRTFHVLDPSNVLLSMVVAPLQMYLCQRDDAVRIVVDGLLAEPEPAAAARGSGGGGEQTTTTTTTTTTATTVAERIALARRTAGTQAASTGGSGKLAELAVLLSDPAQQRRRHVDEEELDWNDMEWVPDPIDAGTNYRRPKSEDVIGTLIGALGSPDAFTVEFQNIIAERLLSSQVVFAKEVKVLNLLKRRFGESALQNCEVMIRDIQDSNRLDAIIHQMQQQQRRQGMGGAADIQYQAKILSRLYWPGLGHEPFLLPAPVAALQTRYEAGYEQRKARRKLAWLNQLGQARVELALADRVVLVACKTYEAAVIYAFQDPAAAAADETPGEEGPPVRRSVAELVEMLQMDEDLVVPALAFWQKQGVLRPDAAADAYVVVEHVAEAGEGGAMDGDRGSDAEEVGDEDENDGDDDDDDADDGNAQHDSIADNTAAAAAPRTRQARADEAQRTVYWQFIVGMLTNSAASMPLAQIAMMLKMLVAGGFSWGDEELQEFLGEKTADGELEVVGGKYRLVKK